MDTLIWKTTGKELKIKSLNELLNILVDVKQEDINKEIGTNLSNLIGWLEQSFPKELDLIAGIKGSIKEFTPQQIRELIIRKLRKII